VQCSVWEAPAVQCMGSSSQAMCLVLCLAHLLMFYVGKMLVMLLSHSSGLWVEHFNTFAKPGL
jgi:hypothetical protein